MVVYTGPVHWERVLKMEAKNYQHLAHNCSCKSHSIVPWKIWEREGRKHSAFPNFRTDRRFIFVQCKVEVLGKRQLNWVQE